jgi:hypothetical protein
MHKISTQMTRMQAPLITRILKLKKNFGGGKCLSSRELTIGVQSIKSVFQTLLFPKNHQTNNCN